MFCKLLDNGEFDSFLYRNKDGDEYYPYVQMVPPHTSAQSVMVTGFVWLKEGETATGVYMVVDLPPPKDEEATEADKDAALARFGVEV